MNFEKILDMFATLPTWVWIVAAVIFVFFAFGERILWDYEVKFPYQEGIGRGEVELECGKKRGTWIECVFELEPSHQKTALDIFLKERKLYTVPAGKINSKRFRLKEYIPFDEPKEGDPVVVKANGTTLFSGVLVLD